MSAERIDGKAFAETLRQRIAREVAVLKDAYTLVPGLAVILVGQDPASEAYVRSKDTQTKAAGMASFEHKLPETAQQAEVFALIKRLNADPAVHGILVQLPLPGHMDATAVIDAIDPAKEVDGFHISNVGLLGTDRRPWCPVPRSAA